MNKAEELDFLGLLVRYQDHVLDAEGTARLDDLLQTSARARELFQDTALHALKVYELHNGDYADYACATSAPDRPIGRVIGIPLQAWAAAAAVVLVAGLLWTWKAASPPSVPTAYGVSVAAFTGEVKFTSPGEPERRLVARSKLPPGTRISTGAMDSRAALFYADGTRLLVGPHAVLVLGREDGKQVRLDHGVLTSEIAQQPDGRPMRFRTGDTEVEVLGTGLTLVRKDPVAQVLVHEGRVKVTRLQDRATGIVSAGQQVRVHDTGALEVKSLPEVPIRYVQDFSTPPEGWQDGWHQSSGTLRLIPEGYSLPEANDQPPRRPIALVMENAIQMRHEFLSEEPAGFHVRESMTGRAIFLPKNRIDQFSIYGEWTDGNGVFSEDQYANRNSALEGFLDLDLDGLDDRRQVGPGKPSLSKDSSGIVRDSNGASYAHSESGWTAWEESYVCELSDSRYAGREGWVRFDADSRVAFRCHSEGGGVLRMFVRILDLETLRIDTLEREFKLTDESGWGILETELGTQGGHLLSLRMQATQPGLLIDDVQIGPPL